MSRWIGRLAASLAAALALASPLSPQQAPAAGDFGSEVSVTVVPVPVQVTRGSEPVAGLTADDFEVYDDGVKREISSFEVVDLRPQGAAGAPPAAASAPTYAGRSLLVLLDLAYSPPLQIVRAIPGIERMIREQLNPADRVALALYSRRRGARLLVGFTDDQRLLVDALETMKRQLTGEKNATVTVPPGTPRGATAGTELAELSERMGAAAALALSGRDPRQPLVDVGMWGGVAHRLSGTDSDGSAAPPGPIGAVALMTGSALAESLQAQADMRTEITRARQLSKSLGELATLLRGVGGQKHLLYLSRGFPDYILEEPVIAGISETLFEAFQRAGWQIDAIDTRGIPDAFGGGLQTLGIPGSDANEPAADARRGTIAFQSDTMLYLARGTGGEVYELVSDVGDATSQIIARTQLTYLLAFTLTDAPADGRYHHLQVRLRGGDRGAKLRYREGYYADRPQADKSELERGMEDAERLLGGDEGGLLAVTAQAFPLAPRDGVARVPLFVEVSGASLAPLPAAAHRRTLRVRAVALDERGVIRGSFAHEVAIDLDRAPALVSHGARLYGELAAPAADLRLRLEVDDVEGRRSWLGTLPVHVAGADEPSLAPPLFLNADRGWLMMPMAAASPPAAYPFRVGGRDVAPALAPSLALDEKRPVLLLLQGGAPGGGAVAARVTKSDGTVAGGGRFELLAREPAEDGGERLVGDFSPAGLAPGTYRLEVTLRVDGRARAVSSAPFEVRQSSS